MEVCIRDVGAEGSNPLTPTNQNNKLRTRILCQALLGGVLGAFCASSGCYSSFTQIATAWPVLYWAVVVKPVPYVPFAE